MKRNSRALNVLLGVAVLVFTMVGCGNSSSEKIEKVGEVSDSTESEMAVSDKENIPEEATDEQGEAAEKKSEYHVGESLIDNDVQIVYVASGEYKEDNEFLQPAEGKKFVFIKLAFENKGKSDKSISAFNFEAYADGYSAEQHYTDNDLSATLSSGRTTDGTVVFEVPSDAKEIEFEYSTNIFSKEKIKFIYDGDKDSGYVQEGNTNDSVEAFLVGDIVESKNLNIVYISCEKDTSYSRFSEPKDGYHYVTLTFEFENKGSGDEHVSMYDFDCYADGKNCDQAYFRDDSISATLSSGRKAKGTVTYEVPDAASSVEVEFVSNIWTSSRVVFKVSE